MAFGYACSVLGDFHLAEDAAQEAFVEAFRCLGSLRAPAAFPGWLRRIVFKHCDRLTRRQRTLTVPLSSTDVPARGADPARAAEQREMTGHVLEAIRSLPEPQRAVTTLFYVNGYSQADIAAFLEVPPPTVRTRLHAARKHLRERMIHMVEETLHENAPDERFSVKVIESLLARPKLLEIEGHPVRQVWEAMRAALPDYDVVHGEEIEDSEAFAAAEDHAWDGAYRLGKDQALRYQTTTVTLAAIRGRTAPVRLLAPGRVFRPEREDAGHMKVFHQVDGVCVDAGADMAGFKATCERTVKAAVPGAEIIRREHDYGLVSLGAEAVIVQGEARYEVLGGGMLRAETLDNAGYDPGAVSGFAWGLSLERLAMLRFDIDDIRKLWAPPYVPGR